MPNLNRNIRNTDSFFRVREILAKNNSILGKTTLTVFIALGLLALASPIALPSGIAALGIGAVGIFLDQATQDNLSENEILQGVQKIFDANGLLERKDFYDYMAPYYTKLLQIKGSKSWVGGTIMSTSMENRRNDPVTSDKEVPPLKRKFNPLFWRLSTRTNDMIIFSTSNGSRSATVTWRIHSLERERGEIIFGHLRTLLFQFLFDLR